MMEQTFSGTEKSNELEQQISALLATYETAMARIAQREKLLENHIQASENFLNQQIEKINLLMSELRALKMEERGENLARWQLSAQKALKLGDTQLQSLRKLKEDTTHLMKESCNRFEHTSNITAKHMNEAIHHFKADNFKEQLEKNYDGVKKAFFSTTDNITQILRWLQWKNLTLALGLSIVASIAIGLYIDAEWPWELHSKVVQQRTAGEALISAWPRLSKTDRQYLSHKIQLQNKT